MELQEAFSFFEQNYKFSPKFKNRMWDGKIYLYKISRSSLYIGLIDELKKFAISFGYQLKDAPLSTILADSNKKIFENEQKISELSNFINLIPNKYKLRDYQLFSVLKSILLKRVIIQQPTGSGKSASIYSFVRWFNFMYEKPVLIIVPTIGLVAQMKYDFLDYDNTINSNSILEIYSGQDKSKMRDSNLLAVVSTWQSLITIEDKEFFSLFRAVVVDECHGAKALSIKKIMEACDNAEFRIGTTGTIPDDPLSKNSIIGLFGKIISPITTKQLQDKGILSQLKIKCIKINYSQEDKFNVCHHYKDYQKEQTFLMEHRKRQNYVANIASEILGNTLVLFSRVEYGRVLHKKIKEINQNNDRKIFLIYGGTDVEDREKARLLMEKEKNAIIVASSPTFSTGINIRNLHNIIFTQGGKSAIRIIQSIGRGLRIADNGQETTLIDIVDDLTWKKHESFSIKHAAERLQIYINQQFSFEVINIDF
jgi:superfamily II DNA or RNA helicase